MWEALKKLKRHEEGKNEAKMEKRKKKRREKGGINRRSCAEKLRFLDTNKTS